MPKYVFISQPMRGKPSYQIKAERADLEEKLMNQGYIIINSMVNHLVPEYTKNEPLYCLGLALERMADADVVVFMKGWNRARGCKIEHHAAKAYGMDIMYEKGMKL